MKDIVSKKKNKLSIDESIYISDGKKIERTNQIVIIGYANAVKTLINWSIYEAAQ